jgi:general secretion pathway protein D
MNHFRHTPPTFRFARSRTMRLALAASIATTATCLGQSQSSMSPGPATAPSTAPSTTAFSATRPNGNGVHGVTTQPGGGLLLNFKDASIDAVLDELSSAAGFIVVKEVKPEGRVTLVSKQAVSPDEAVSLLNTVLRNAKYAAIQQGRILKVVNADAAKRLNIPVRSGSDPEKIANTDELITQVIPLRYADATQLKQDLQPMINPSADFTSNASSNALVLTDVSANIRRIVEIVNALDTTLADAAEVKVFQLHFASASTAAKLINDVFGNQNQTPGQGGGQQQGGFPGGFGGFPGGGGNRGGGGGFGNRLRQMFGQGNQPARQATRLFASSDDRTNTVIVTGPPDTLKTIERVIREIDANPAADETVFVYHLKNAQALNVEAVTNMLFNGTTGAGQRTQPNLSTARTTPGNSSRNSSRGGAGPGNSNPFSSGGFGSNRSSFGQTNVGGGVQGGRNFGQQGGGFGLGGLSSASARTAADLAGEVTIIADPDTNTMLVRTHPNNYERVKTILDELDRAVPQVLIKVLIAEVTHDNSTDIGAEFSALNIRSSGNGPSIGTNFNLANQTGGLVVQILETNFTATIRALETAGKLDVLSRPYILASDNQLASITVGQEIPFITDSRITDTGQTINTVEYGDIGILLDVIPHINPQGLVILDVSPEISALSDTQVPISNTVNAPAINKRSAQSRVGVQSGQTVVIGGLMEDRKTLNVSKVPFLGDIPWLGEAFKRQQISKTKTELLIFLTPHVAAEPVGLKDMSQDELKGTKLTPNAVGPGEFDEHMRGLERGEDKSRIPTTEPTTPEGLP